MPSDSLTSGSMSRAAMTGNRGPLHIHCPKCRAFRRSSSLKIRKTKDSGTRRFYYPSQPDISWFKRKRRCAICETVFYTGEVSEDLIEELFQLREKLKKYRLPFYKKLRRDIRKKISWLDTKGDEVPVELCENLIRETAWWLTHSSGTPVRAPGHAQNLYRSYCGWAVEFGANSFVAGRALAKARDYANEMFELADVGGMPPDEEIRNKLSQIPSQCVLNVNSDLYTEYPVTFGLLIFGAQAININDCVRVFMESTGLEKLVEAYSEIENDE
jgi:hypothetical protein